MDWADRLREAIDLLASEVLLDAPISEVHEALYTTARRRISLSFSVHRDVGDISEHLDVVLSTEAPEIKIKGMMADLSISGAEVREGATLRDAVDAVVAFERNLRSNAWCRGSIECMPLSRFSRSTIINYPRFSVGIHPDRQVSGAYEVVIYGDGYSLKLRGIYGDYMRPIDAVEAFARHVKPLFV
jgi:hypothetical protein